MEWVPAVLAFLVALLSVVLTMPPLIRKMTEGGMVGRDVNKKHRPEVAELGGIAALFAFAISLSLVVGLEKLAGDITEPPYLAAIAVFFIASMIGLIDDISNVKQRVKAVVVVFASLPLLLVHFHAGPPLSATQLIGPGTINISENAFIALPFGQMIDLTSIPLLFWFILHPARMFVGDIGSLGLGAAIAAGAIIGGIEVWGLIAIAPAFYEAGATLWYGGIRKVSRREGCHSPLLAVDGKPSPPKGAERDTLAYLILGRRPMTEPRLVATLLSLYALSGLAA